MNFGFSTQVARKTHCCDYCMQSIYRHDEYNRWLWKVAPRRVIVMRVHAECPPDEHRDDGAYELPIYDALPLAA